MHTLFISDLHLTPERPRVTQAFFDFLEKASPAADALYILGDLFEYWIGDDAVAAVRAESIVTAMQNVAQQTNCFFMPGNRDFLVTEKFTALTGFTLMSDETVLDLYGEPTLLLHGDSLCTDDVKHQQYRQDMMTNRAFHTSFLSLPVNERIHKAQMARTQSRKNKQFMQSKIMDVTESAVLAAFAKHQVRHMIHGHTHRQNTHIYDGLTRIVLGDWNHTSSVLRIDAQGAEFTNTKIS